jgi:hypothetical protein
VTLDQVEESQKLATEGCSSYDVIDEGYKFSGTTVGIGIGILTIAIGGGVVELVRFIKKKVKAAKEKKAAAETTTEEPKEETEEPRE